MSYNLNTAGSNLSNIYLRTDSPLGVEIHSGLNGTPSHTPSPNENRQTPTHNANIIGIPRITNSINASSQTAGLLSIKGIKTPPTSPERPKKTHTTPSRAELSIRSYLAADNGTDLDPFIPLPTNIPFDLTNEIEQIKEATSIHPLKPAGVESNTMVYMTDRVVFKPYIDEGKLTVMASELSKAAGIPTVVPQTKLGTACIEVKLNQFIFASEKKTNYLARKEEILYLDSNSKNPNNPDSRLCKHEGIEFSIVKVEGKNAYVLEETHCAHETSTDETTSDSSYTDESTEQSSSDSSDYESYSESYSDSTYTSLMDFPLEPNVEYKLLKPFDSSYEFCLVPTEDCYLITTDQVTNARKVKISDQDFDIEESNGVTRIIGRNVQGLYQEKLNALIRDGNELIEEISTLIETPTKTGRIPFDLRAQSPLNQLFFSKIMMKDFINTFLMIMLTRHPDAKASQFGDSNILFQHVETNSEKKLKPSLIDFAGAFSKSNTFREDVSQKNEKIHVVRNGLMGYRQAKDSLKQSEVLHIAATINKLHENKQKILQDLSDIAQDDTLFGPDHQKALVDVIDKMKKSIDANLDNKSWSLQKLFFDTFPEYKEQWDSIDQMVNEMENTINSKDLEIGSHGNLTLKRSIKASLIGNTSPEKIVKASHFGNKLI